MMDKSPRVPRSPASLAEFEELLIAHQGPVFRYILSFVADHHEAEDLLQKTNLILWRKRDCFEAGSNFKAWSFAVARLEALKSLRRQRRDRRVFLQQQRETAVIDDDKNADAEKRESLAALRECLKGLPPRDQELIRMRYGSDRTLSDYARNLNRSPGTLKARLFKIRESLRKSIVDYLRKEEALQTRS